jgi:hypothetical protein
LVIFNTFTVFHSFSLRYRGTLLQWVYSNEISFPFTAQPMKLARELVFRLHGWPSSLNSTITFLSGSKFFQNPLSSVGPLPDLSSLTALITKKIYQCCQNVNFHTLTHNKFMASLFRIKHTTSTIQIPSALSSCPLCPSDVVASLSLASWCSFSMSFCSSSSSISSPSAPS